MIRRALRGALTVAALVCGLALSCTPVVPPNLTTVDRMCDSLCNRRVECRAGWDRKICEDRCHDDPGGKTRPYWRTDYVDAVVQCVQTSSCEVILGKVGATCFRETRPEPSDVARRACIAAESKNRECSGSPEDIEECLNKWNWRLYSDEVLTRLAECEDERCGRNRRVSCVRAVLGTD